mgnify:FL=1
MLKNIKKVLVLIEYVNKLRETRNPTGKRNGSNTNNLNIPVESSPFIRKSSGSDDYGSRRVSMVSYSSHSRFSDDVSEVPNENNEQVL